MLTVKIRNLIPLLLLTALSSCKNETQRQHTDSTHQPTIVPQNDSGNKQALSAVAAPVSDAIKPLFGYRFIVSGDFDGDGQQDQLVEHFFSTTENKETNKFYEGLQDYDQLVELTAKKIPASFVTNTGGKIDTLYIATGAQLLGLSLLKNEGDLNGDGTDEISYVVNWADWSNLNTWHIMTYKNNKWSELYSFGIWDWQLPDLPETFNQYGLFGLENKTMISGNDSLNKDLERQLNEFPGLVRKIDDHKIQITFRNDEADEETKVVDLRKRR